jgi:anti-sigma regulatory factor (Ser/Thr protein kinase)
MPSVEAASEAAIALRHDPAEMQRLSAWIDRRIEALALGETAAYAARLCLEEAVQNIIMHNAAPADPTAAIRVWLDRGDGQLGASVTDHGAAFDPLSVPPPAPAKDLATAPVGGLGIPLMRRFSRAIAYRREDGANILTFRFDD